MRTLVTWQQVYDQLKIETQLAIWVNEVLLATLKTLLRCGRHMDESFAILLQLKHRSLELDSMKAILGTLIEPRILTLLAVKCNQQP